MKHSAVPHCQSEKSTATPVHPPHTTPDHTRPHQTTPDTTPSLGKTLTRTSLYRGSNFFWLSSSS
jgi:hypothetical protein